VSDLLGKPLPFDSFDQLRAAMIAEVPRSAATASSTCRGRRRSSTRRRRARSLPDRDFYLTNAICRASPTMQRCSEELVHGQTGGGGGMSHVPAIASMRRRRRGPRPRPSLRVAVGMSLRMTALSRMGHGVVGLVLATIIGILVIALPLMLAVAMIIYAERKIWAAIALRRGPNVVGPWGLLQSFADGLKVFLKETIIPSSANKGLFLIAPIITFTVALIVWAVVPFDVGVVLPTSMSACSTSSRRARSASTA
jgi:hypothetical protein